MCFDAPTRIYKKKCKTIHNNSVMCAVNLGPFGAAVRRQTGNSSSRRATTCTRTRTSNSNNNNNKKIIVHWTDAEPAPTAARGTGAGTMQWSAGARLSVCVCGTRDGTATITAHVAEIGVEAVAAAHATAAAAAAAAHAAAHAAPSRSRKSLNVVSEKRSPSKAATTTDRCPRTATWSSQRWMITKEVYSLSSRPMSRCRMRRTLPGTQR